LQQLQAAGRAGGLRGIEIINGVVLSDDEWTPQNVSDSQAIWSSNFTNEALGFHDRCAKAPAQEDPQPLRVRNRQGLRQEVKEACQAAPLDFLVSRFIFIFSFFSLLYLPAL
jgi:hypothetical protein